jgi:hypothetical protein
MDFHDFYKDYLTGFNVLCMDYSNTEHENLSINPYKENENHSNKTYKEHENPSNNPYKEHENLLNNHFNENENPSNNPYKEH